MSQDTMNDERSPRRYRLSALTLAAVAVTLIAACDLEVASPATVEDDQLNDPDAFLAVVRGAHGDFAYASAGEPGPGGAFTAGALLTDELVYSGTRPGLIGFSDGVSQDDSQATADLWAHASQARFTGESAVARIRDAVNDPASREERTEALRWAQAAMWAGFSNRLLGDNFCEAVIDVGPIEDHTVFFERAEALFSEAIEIGAAAESEGTIDAGHAGRAQTRMMRGDWEGAVADAGMVDTDFAHEQLHHFISFREFNFFRRMTLFDAAETTVWGTPFESWGVDLGLPEEEQEGDPRVSYDGPVIDDELREAGDGRRPFLRQRKHHPNWSGNLVIARGTEMRLIEAEAELVAGNWQAAVDKINEVRQFRIDPPFNFEIELVEATSEREAWELLMRERGLELWMEGRRLPDFRRWAVNPGFVPTEVVREAGAGDAETDARRNALDISGELCIPISADERRTNPNL